MKVFVVTDGSYSDYHIKGIFSTKEKADKAKGLWHTDNEVDEMELDVMPECPVGLLPFVVHMTRDGTTKCVERTGIDLVRSMGGFHGSGFYQDIKEYGFSSYMFAKDEQHAIKIANEKRIQVLALDIWDWKTWDLTIIRQLIEQFR